MRNQHSGIRLSLTLKQRAAAAARVSREKSSSERQHDAADLSEGLATRSAPEKDFREEIKPRRKQS